MLRANVVGAAFFLGLGVTRVAEAQTLGTHQTHFRVDAGVRANRLTHEGYDPFSKNDAFIQGSLGASRTFFAEGPLSVAGVFFWDYGNEESTARLAKTSLDVHRLTLGPELRYHVLPFAFVFARVMPGAMYRAASLDDSIVGFKRYSREWSFALDASLGGAVEIWGMQNPDSKRARFWAVAEAGYGYATGADLSFSPSDDDAKQAPQRLEAVDLGDLAVRGLMLRVSAALSF
jgi:hypothetical protein